MKIEYTDAAKRAPDFKLLEGASLRLEEILEPASEPLTATWDRNASTSGPPYILTLTDPYGDTHGTFSPDELRPGTTLDLGLLRLLRLALHQGMKKQLQVIRDLGD